MILGLYGAVLLILLPYLPLWLDEVLDVIGVSKPTIPDLIGYVATNSGGVPLGYLLQRLSLHLFGFSEFSARLPSVLSSIAAAYGLFRLAERLQMRRPLATVLLFCFLPLQWRYALEARPYAMALALSVWSTILFLHLLKAPTIHRACCYALILTAGLYTNPYSFFVAIAQVAWLLFHRRAFKPTALLAMPSIALAGLLFLPWYLYARSGWIAGLTPSGHTPAIKTVELIAKEVVGAGYIGTAVVLLLAWLGWRKQRIHSPNDASLLATCFLLPFPMVLAGNFAFHYFLASRQFLFVLPPLCLLAAYAHK